MGKIQRCPEITQARFMRLICLYWNKECVLSYEDAEIEIDKEHLDILIGKKIIKIEDNFLLIEFLNEQLESIAETSQKRREAVLQRWAKVKQKDTSVSEIDTNVLQNDTDKSREEEEEKRKDIIEPINWPVLLDFFNKTTGKKCKVVSRKAKEQFNARLKEGFTKVDIANAIVNASNDTYHIENKLKYITLEFISRADKLDKFSQVDNFVNNGTTNQKLMKYDDSGQLL
jgi:uncharacterized phage protein (TIGR02220 family)